MFIAHLPAGYLLTRLLQKKLRTNRYLWAGLLASVLPDVDLIYFYLIDNQQTNHHDYWTHIPVFWLTIGLVLALVAAVSKNRSLLVFTIIFTANVMLHLLLDSLAGGIAWLYPLIDTHFQIATVPATYSSWILSFVLHWTFAFEILITLVAAYWWYSERKSKAV